MSFSAAIKSAQSNVPECVAVGYVDMTTGMLLDVNTVDSHPSEVLDLVAAAKATPTSEPVAISTTCSWAGLRST